MTKIAWAGVALAKIALMLSVVPIVIGLVVFNEHWGTGMWLMLSGGLAFIVSTCFFLYCMFLYDDDVGTPPVIPQNGV